MVKFNYRSISLIDKTIASSVYGKQKKLLGLQIDPLVDDSLHVTTHAVSVLRHFDTSWEDVEAVQDKKCVTLNCWKKKAPICVYNATDDKYISASITNSGCWEKELVLPAMLILEKHREMIVLDLGCNIGVFTITAAAEGYNVIGVDPLRQNLNLLSKSLRLGGLKKKVRLVWNAISNSRGIVVLKDDNGNVGGTAIETLDDPETKSAGIDEDHVAFAVLLDDLIDMFDDKPVFIKMDIEGSEFDALRGGEKFFREKDVQYILMEWFQHRGKHSGNGIIDFFKRMSFVPYAVYDIGRRLDTNNSLKWQDNVLWHKQNTRETTSLKNNSKR